MELKFGVFAKDVITGFEGYVTGRTTYISGCSQLLLQPVIANRVTKDRPAGEWFDEQRIQKLTDKRRPDIVLDNAKTPGFDMEAPKR